MIRGPLQSLIESKKIWRLLIVGVVVLALLLRVWAALMLPIDYDEPVYLEAGYDYAAALRAGDINALIDYRGNREHPALVKILYGFGWLVAGENARLMEAGYVARFISALFGTLSVLLVALVDPLAGGLLAVHTMEVKYTSQAYLEAVPQFAAIACVLALARSRSDRGRWFWLSAAALGMTAAGKFTYFPIIFPVLALLAGKKYPRWWAWLGYFATAAIVFWALNPMLWRQPVARLVDSLTFHLDYSQSAHVQGYQHPWYQPVVWVLHSVSWHPRVFFYPGLDSLIFILAVPGAVLAWREGRQWPVIWLVTSLVTLFLWPTKWPQYTLILIPALCLLAAESVVWVYRWFRDAEQLRDWLRMMHIPLPRIAWILLAVYLIYVVGASIVNGVRVQVERLNWWNLMSYDTPLPSNIVHDLLVRPGGGVAVATEGGLAIWYPSQDGTPEGAWVTYDTDNSGLPHDRVLSLTEDSDGSLWVGTDDGVARYLDGGWTTFDAADLGRAETQIWDLAVDGMGRIWAATSRGALRYDGAEWEPFTSANSGLVGDFVFVIERAPGSDRVCFGTDAGLSVLSTETGLWERLTPPEMNVGEGVSSLSIDREGRIWMGTLGRGLGRWDGETWDFFRTGVSPLPFNTVTTLFQDPSGLLWIGTAEAAQAGGAVTTFDGEDWQTFAPENSGYLGAEPLAMAGVDDFFGRGEALLIGTRTFGVAVYQPR